MATGTLTIDLDAIAANWRALDALSAPGVETAAVVKADAYGLGAGRVVPVLARAGARAFFVAVAEEGAAVRAALGPDLPVFVFGGYMPGDAPLVRDHDLTPLLNSPEQVTRFLADHPGRPAGLQLDTGMNRLGMEPAELAALGQEIAALVPVLVMSHLAAADAPEAPLNALQQAAFAALRATLPDIPASLAATGGCLLGPDYHFEMTRPGIGLYGGLPFAGAAPVVSLDLPVIQTRDVAEGEIVGYGGAWRAPRPCRIATIGAGYADGIPRITAGAMVFADAVPCPVVGRISMDLITVDVTDLPEIPATLSLLSPHQTVDDLAALSGTIGYEILTGLGQRYDRRYIGG